MLEKNVLEKLNREKDDLDPLVVMMCGIAGSGKTTFSQKLEKAGFVRLSIDEEVWSTNGRYGIDYPIEKYREYLDKAHLRLRDKLVKLILNKQQVVVDSSFWRQSERVEYKQLIETAGGKWRLIYLKVNPNDLRERLKMRSNRFDANAAFPITEEILTSFLNEFEVPKGEGEIVIEF
ncbi:Zeta toxin [Neobacillus massiliamazoniensis]|uniref:Zeta toxin n=2 Tax=Neobacillus massiliamazoniensis TaxID=1499688 RepID=A0A0U1NZB8_9BACI|nr:ATP-binding protein [Neobacillus massiliamazoniensis]CRK83364.1 Zeta toxin [Neobacillus massiliamazoniensis]